MTAVLDPAAATAPQRSRDASRRAPFAAVAIAVAVVTAFGGWVLWHSLLVDDYGRPAVDTVIKDYYLGDQFAYLGIAANVVEGRPAHIEPYTATGSSIYPSGYYWLIGVVSRVTGISTFGAWNVVGALVDLALFAGVGAFGWIVTRNRWAWVLGPIPALIGTFQYWTIGSWRAIYGAHAVLWPVAASLFSPGAEPAALVLAGVCLALLVAQSHLEGGRRWAAAGGAGAALALTLYVHTYVAIFAATTAALWFAVQTWQLVDRRRRAVLLAVTVLAALLVMAVPGTFPLLRAVVVIAAAMLGSAVVGGRRSPIANTLAVFVVSATMLALPMAARIASQVGDRDSFLYQRQASGVATDLSLPLKPVLFHSAPTLLLVAGCLLHLHRRRTANPMDGAWYAAVVALALGAGLLVFNESWGLQQEPYRFLPYSHLLLAAFALPWIVSTPAGTRWRSLLARVATMLVAAATLPTTLLMVRETPAVLQSPASEQAAFRRVADALDHDGLALLDACLPRGAFKALTGARVVGLNAGLALPAKADEVREVLAAQAGGVLVDGGTLEGAGVRSLVTIDGCNGPSEAQLRERFGPPVRVVRHVSSPACGLPPVVLRVYAREPGEAGEELHWVPVAAEPGTPAHPFAPCTLTNRRADVT